MTTEIETPAVVAPRTLRSSTVTDTTDEDLAAARTRATTSTAVKPMAEIEPDSSDIGKDQMEDGTEEVVSNPEPPVRPSL